MEAIPSLKRNGTQHVRTFDIPSNGSSCDCFDKDPHCPSLALDSECERNPQYTLMLKEALGRQRKMRKFLRMLLAMELATGLRFLKKQDSTDAERAAG